MSKGSPTAATADTSDRNAAYQEAAVELAKGIALGAVPFLGQAIDAYDTVESAIVLYNAETNDGKEDAKFDLLMAVIGWIPGPGDGLKKSLRIVNRDPQRYAPVLFDLLRFVLEECGVRTSPEELLKQIFDASKLRAELDDIITAVKGSSTFQSLPNWAKSAVITVLATARDNMPEMIGIVEKRLLKWKGAQRNSSAMAPGTSKPSAAKKPAGKDPEVATQGKNGANTTRANNIEMSNVEVKVLSSVSNDELGISGEHIADYICANTFGWGKDWDGHDKGVDGKWMNGDPDGTRLGKLSRGGNPKKWHTLYKLSDGANGTGIDSVWHAGSKANNDGKKYAIVEAKASRDEDAPKFMRQGKSRKHSIVSKLGVAGTVEASELLEPTEEKQSESESEPKKAVGKHRTPSAKKKERAGQTPTKPHPKKPEKEEKKPADDGSPLMVQMSREWIRANIKKAVPDDLKLNILSSYSRHLFYAPMYDLIKGPREHVKALLEQSGPETHVEHAAIHYGEAEVKAAVNKRKASLRAKHGALKTLAKEV
ncbi:hypothetical protein PS718_04472 [Pseudomonas fluorescens]|uniref:Uncharacterized protein n=1 Tax=Pseudomonas fluorescens TaxID=294 RepID=A0A423LIG0_PSEFL|nr:hypothetical protein [Pseudomonas fluorescens]RON68112.1 hypothetical protein BK671_14340 [Pseudomonas fluorescens]VVO24360.1 hypothetical protein PS718_04472 [Pseudomonas fluorescens]